MIIYNVLLESHYENEDGDVEIHPFKNYEDAKNFITDKISQEIEELEYTDEEAHKLIETKNDKVIIYNQDKTDWKFRVNIYPWELK